MVDGTPPVLVRARGAGPRGAVTRYNVSAALRPWSVDPHRGSSFSVLPWSQLLLSSCFLFFGFTDVGRLQSSRVSVKGVKGGGARKGDTPRLSSNSLRNYRSTTLIWRQGSPSLDFGKLSGCVSTLKNCVSTLKGCVSTQTLRCVVHKHPFHFRRARLLHGCPKESKILRREVSKGLQSYFRPVCAGWSSCWP